MATKPLKVHTAFVGTKEKLKDRFLFVGKIPGDGALDSFAFYLIEILSPWHPSTKIEKIVSENLKNDFESDEKFNLEDSLRKINEELGVLANKGESDWIGNLNAIIGYIEKNKDIHLSMAGNIHGYMVRGGKVVTLTEGLESDDPTNPLKTFENITSGKLGAGDQIILANISFYDYLSVDRMRRLLIEFSSKACAKEAHRLLRKSRAKEVSAAIFDVVNADENVKDQDLHEFYWVDQAVDTPFNKFLRAVKPVAQKALKISGEYSRKAYEAGKTRAKTAHKNIKENYAPKTKELLSKGASSVSKKTKGFKTHEIDNISQDPSNLNVKSYRNKKSSINDILKKIFSFFIAFWGIIRPIFKKENRRYLYIIIALILIIAGYFKVKSNNQNREKLSEGHQIEDSLNLANDLFNQAKEDIALGRDGGEDKLLQALSTTEEALEKDDNNQKANDLRKLILDEVDDITSTVRVWEIEPIFEIRGEVVKSILVGETIYSVTDEGRIYSTDTRENSPVLIASVDADSGSVVDMAFSDSADKIYIYKENQKIFSLDVSTETISEITLTSSSSFEIAKAVDAYVTNIYLLDSNAGEVWKHTSSDGVFNSGTAYLDTTSTSIKNAVDLAIDGNIFVLMPNASVKKFVRGSFDQDFGLGSIPSPYSEVDSPSQIFSDADTNYIYILDSARSRIIKFEKNGTYANQYAFESISLDEILINPRVQKLWVESDNKYYELSM